MKPNLMSDFTTIFKQEEVNEFFAPGRVNLIGEHTDYNGGMVFPCAITYGTYAIAGVRNDSFVKLYSNNFKNIGVIMVDLQNIQYKQEDDWANYAKGVLYYMQKQGYQFPHGLNILIEGDIPNGAGLSSSASLEVLIATIFNEMYHLDIPMIDIVKIAQMAENKFIGVNCGIMDQFIIGMGKTDCAIALDTATLDYTYAPIKLQNASIVIMNTNKKRGLADSKYNERRSECEQALKDLQKKLPIKHLCDLSEVDFELHKAIIANPVNCKRAKHVIYENERVKKAIHALKHHDITTFATLMNDSHVSLRDDYEVTGKELDTLVSSAWKQPGVMGARMTGAGFGGCAIAIVKDEAIPTFKAQVEKEYTEIIGYAPTFYIASIGDGAKKL